ncbi:hypothetical protein K4F52_006173 [Lecanicillium sp. MT-2017a]|nr:hypothetical protein K4F52_006173 [Lecanicillium sp. MT-2017a]
MDVGSALKSALVSIGPIAIAGALVVVAAAAAAAVAEDAVAEDAVAEDAVVAHAFLDVLPEESVEQGGVGYKESWGARPVRPVDDCPAFGVGMVLEDIGAADWDSISHEETALEEKGSPAHRDPSWVVGMAKMLVQVPLVTLGLGSYSAAHHVEETARAFGMGTVVDMLPGDTVRRARHIPARRALLVMREAAGGEDSRGSRRRERQGMVAAAAVGAAAAAALEALSGEGALHCRKC